MWLKILAVGVLCLAVNVSAQNTNSPARNISLDECLRMALLHNFDLQIERHAPEIARFTLSSAYGIYDPTFEFIAKQSYDSIPNQVDPKKPNEDAAYTVTTDRFGPRLNGTLPTGLSYGLSAESDFYKFSTALPPSLLYPYGLRETNEYATAANLNLRQPLLRNLWIDSGRRTILIDKKNLKIAEQTLQQEMINVVTKVKLGYFELVFAREEIKVREKALELARQLASENRKRVEAGTLAPLQEKQSESQVETYITDLIAAQQSFADQQNALKALIDDNFRHWPDVQLEPAETLAVVPFVFHRAECWQTALDLRPDYQQMRLEVEKSNIQIRYTRNQLFPNLDVVGSYGGIGVRDTFDDAFGDTTRFTYPNYSYGVILSVPLSRQAERNNYKAAQSANKQAQLQLKKLEQDILVQVDNAGRLIQTTYQRVNSTRQARIYAEAAVEAEQKSLAYGRSTSFVVLEMERMLTAARFAEIRAIADYNKALVQLAFSEGSTLKENQLEVKFR